MNSNVSLASKGGALLFVLVILVFVLLITAWPLSAQGSDFYYEERSGTIDRQNESDWWRFEGKQGWEMTLNLRRESGNLDPVVWLMDANENMITYNDDYSGTMNSHLTIRLPYTGRYYVAVGSARGRTAGRYALSVLHSDPDGGTTGIPGPGSSTTLYVSSSFRGQIGSLNYKDEDILAYNSSSGDWSMYFDGSDVGLSGDDADLDAIVILPNKLRAWDDDRILFSLNKAYNVPGVGTVDDSDIVMFIPTRLGNSTAGTFVKYFDGSDVGLGESNAEDVDSISYAEEGNDIWLVISTKGDFNVFGTRGSGQDLLLFDAEKLGSTTRGKWKFYFDGSDVGLSNTSENIVGLTIQNNDNFLTTEGSYGLSGGSGDGNDIFKCTPDQLSRKMVCPFNSTRLWDGSRTGLSAQGNVDAIHVVGL